MASVDITPAPGAARRRRTRSRRSLTAGSALALGATMIWFSLLVLIPLAAVLISAAGLGLEGFWEVVTQPQTAAALRLTVMESWAVTALNIVMGTALAWVLVRDRFWGKRLVDVFIDVPFALPTIVAGLVLLSLYGPSSPLGVNVANTRIAVFLALAFVTLPFVVRTVQPVLESLERDVEEAAASLGASRLTTFRRVILPSLIPAIAAGAALSFARGISEYGSLVLLSGNLPFKTEVASVRVLTFIENGDRGAASTVAAIMLLIALLVIIVLDVIQGSWPAVATSTYTRDPVPVRWGLRVITVGYVALLVAWPTALVFKNALADGFAAMVQNLQDPEIAHALYLTGYVTIIAVLINLVFGLTISILLVRHDFPGKRLLSALLDVPLSISPVVVGLALVLVYNGRDGWFGPALESAGFQVIFATPGMIMATVFVALPLMIREVVPVLEEIGDDQEQAARSLGANAVQTLRRITLPAIKWAIVYGVVLTLARSLGEFGALKIVSGNIAGQSQTATLSVEETYQNFQQSTAYALAALLAFIAMACLVVVALLRPKDEEP